MSRQQYKFTSQATSLIFKGMSLSASLALMLNGSGVFALEASPRPQKSASVEVSSFQLAQQSQEESESDNSSAEDEDVIVDTKPGSPESTTTGSDSGSEDSTADEKRFRCELHNGQYTVMYSPQSQPNQAYPWATPRSLGGGWTAERRCNEISRRLEFYRPEGLQEMRTAVENNYNTVCVTTQKNPDCQIVLTVPPGQNPEITRDKVFENITTADTGTQTEAVNTFVGSRDAQLLNDILNLKIPGLNGSRNSRSRSQSINLRPFLDRADGGTGTKLRGGVQLRNRSNSTPRQLNPNNFR